MRGSTALRLSIACAAALTGLSLAAPVRALEPSVNYALQCMGCHTPDGSEIPERVPAIRKTLLPFAKLPEGRQFLVQVPGSAQSTLSNAELAELLNWMIENLGSATRGSFERFTESEVAGYRADTLVAVRATRERLLLAIDRKQ